MNRASLSFIGRNLLGLLAVLLAHNIVDQYYLGGRPSLTAYSPYLFLVLMYVWIVFHNRILFERLFLRGNRVAYVGWLLLFLLVGTVNMHLILRGMFGVAHTLPFILRYYSDTVTGLGVYVTFRYLTNQRPVLSAAPHPEPVPPVDEPNRLTYLHNGVQQTIQPADITYIEGLENYLKIVTANQTHVVRMTLKEAESRLPKSQFVRISKSHIVNIARTERVSPDDVRVGTRTLRIGRVFKRYASERLLALETSGRE